MQLTTHQHGLFSIPVWEIDLSDALSDVRDQLISDAHNALDERPAQNRPFRQSEADLPDHYLVFEELGTLFNNVVTEVIDLSFRKVVAVAPPTVRTVNCWALEIADDASWDLEAQQLRLFHNHPGFSFSSVLFLDADEDSAAPGGTMFRSPHTHADPRFIPPVSVVPWTTSHLLVFPSWLQHAPARPGNGDRPRLTIAADFQT